MSTLDGMTVHIFKTKPFSFQDLLSRIPLIGDGTPTPNNEVIQGKALPNRSTPVSMRFYAIEDLQAVQNLDALKTEVTYVDRQGASHQVVVDNFDADEEQYFWTATMTFIEVGTPPELDL